MISQLDMELFVNSPTFRRQVANAMTNVGVTRWKVAVATIITVDALITAGAATPEQTIAHTLAKTEKVFLENVLSLQGVNLGQGTSQGYAQPPLLASAASDAAKDGTTRMINMLLSHPSWDWDIATWISDQSTALVEIQERMNELLGDLAGLPQ